MRQVKSRAILVLLQMLVMLALIAAATFYYRETWLPLYLTREAALLGLLLNGGVLALFLLGLLRILILFFSFAGEQRVLNRFIERAQGNVANPTYKLSIRSLVVERYEAIRWLRQQNASLSDGNLRAKNHG